MSDGDEADGPATSRTRKLLSAKPPIPSTGEVVIHGKTRQIAVVRPRPTLLGRRYAVVYDVDGPRARMGVLWFGLAIGALVLGKHIGRNAVPPAVLYGAMAGLAGYQSARAWKRVGSGANPWVAAAGGTAIGGGAVFGIGFMGLAILVLVVVAVLVSAFEVRLRSPLFEAAGTTVQCALFAGLAAAGVVLTVRLEFLAALTLVLLVSAYEVGDFIVGSGASSSLEGPVSGIVAMAIVCAVIAVLRVSPFDGTPVFVFGGFAAVGCPLGQLAASAILPRADARALALRRLDSLIVLGPTWALLIGLYLQHLAST